MTAMNALERNSTTPPYELLEIDACRVACRRTGIIPVRATPTFARAHSQRESSGAVSVKLAEPAERRRTRTFSTERPSADRKPVAEHRPAPT